jgi:hypothetical protein
MSRSFKLVQPELVYSVDDLLEKKNDDLERSQFATKGDIRDLSQQLPLEPAFAQDTNLVKAKKLQETLNQILDDNKLTDQQKSLLLIRAKKQLIFFLKQRINRSRFLWTGKATTRIQKHLFPKRESRTSRTSSRRLRDPALIHESPKTTRGKSSAFSQKVWKVVLDIRGRVV